MNSAELGKRIKEARLAKKMTQSELVGTFITRNMLSQIESGNACPSVKTLEYLAQRLDLPAGSLICDGDAAPAEEKNHEILLSAKRCYLNENYAAAVNEAQRLLDTEFSDEASAILSRSQIEMAKELVGNGDLTGAAKLSQSAMRYADSGIYKTHEISAEAMLMLKDIAAALDGDRV